MDAASGVRTWRGLTRAGLFRTAAGAGAVAAGGIGLGRARGDGASLAAASKSMDEQIFATFLLLERVQEAFYREALSGDVLGGELRSYAAAVADQEREHASALAARAGDRAGAPPRTDFAKAVASPESFRQTAVDLEEAVIAAYVGQAANLTGRAMRFAATLVSVEARQAAWIRDIAGISPAPRAADPARQARDVLDELRQKGQLR